MSAWRNRVIHGDCIEVMRRMASDSVDFILTDPPYLVNYRDRRGRSVANDDDERWVHPAFAEMYRVLTNDSFCLSFYGWSKVDVFMAAWRAAGFCIVGHIVFPKTYASSQKFLRAHHEQAYLLAKGRPALPANPLPDVIDWKYSGNRLHPTQKSSAMLSPLIECFTQPEQIVLDPFCGSGSTLVAARMSGRCCIGIELDQSNVQTAELRLHSM